MKGKDWTKNRHSKEIIIDIKLKMFKSNKSIIYS